MAANTNPKTVIDASFFLAYLMPDESQPQVDRLMDQHVQDKITLVVPLLFFYELSSALNTAIIRHRLTHKKATLLLEETLNLSFEVQANYYPQLLSLAQQHSLSAYDAAYLELAHRLKLPLHSLDKKLANLA